MSVSDAERRRQERRQRILNNQEARMKRILGSNSKFERSTSSIGESPLYQVPTDETETLEVLDFDPKNFMMVQEQENVDAEAINNSIESFLKTTTKESLFKTENATTATTTSKLFTDTSASSNNYNEKRLDSGSNRDEKDLLLTSRQIPIKIHHVFLCLLSLLLSTLPGEHYFLVYFVLYEISIFLYSGYSCPLFYLSKNSSIFTLSILFGVPQIHRDRFEKITLLVNWFSTDLSIFITSALVSSFLSYILSTFVT